MSCKRLPHICHRRRLSRKEPWTYEAEFLGCILQHFPPRQYTRVADVGGGRDARVARFLSGLGYKVTIIDPNAPKRGKGLPRGVKAIRREFLIGDARGFDLLVGLAPCQGSQKLIRAGKRKPFVFWSCGCRRIWPEDQRRASAPTFFKAIGLAYRKQREIFWAPKVSKRG